MFIEWLVIILFLKTCSTKVIFFFYIFSSKDSLSKGKQGMDVNILEHT